MSPVIGITASYSKAVHRVRHPYVDAVERAGGAPVILPAVSDTSVRELFERLDGLVIPGGPAVTLGLVGDIPDDLGATDPRRARFDEAIAARFLDSKKPVLGICYGMQLLNGLDGGTLYADVERQLEGALTHSAKRGSSGHPIEVRPGTRLGRILETSRLDVNSRHVQAVATVGPSFEVSATAPDGVVEAIEADDGRVLGVQFHPERMPLPALFESFVAEAEHRRAARARSTGR